MTEIDTAGLSMLTLAELLAHVDGLFDAVSLESGDVRERRVRELRQAVGEVHRRAAEISPALRLSCSCGSAFTSAEGLDEHFYDVFVPADDFGLDGRVHVEVSAEEVGVSSGSESA